MTKCTCTGPICTCDAEGIVKDGASVRVALIDGQRVQDEWPAEVFDAAGVEIKEPKPRKKELFDLADGWGAVVEQVNKERA